MFTKTKKAKIVSIKKAKSLKKLKSKIVNLEFPMNLEESNKQLAEAGLNEEIIFKINPRLTWNQVFDKIQEGSNSWYNLSPQKIREIMEKLFEPPTLKL